MSSVEPVDASLLTRKELQTNLKLWKLPATGTTAELRKRFAVEAASREGRAVVLLPKDDAPPPQRKSAARKTTATTEKRLRRFRSSCPQKITERIHRAVTQRLYLVQREEVQNLQCSFVVLGSTGNVYTVRIGHVGSCTCPDHARGNLCKHILFVLLKVMGLPSHSHLVYQAAWLTTELEEMFHLLETRRVGGAVLANENVRRVYLGMETGQDVTDIPDKVTRKSLDEAADCPICFDTLDAKREPLTFCRAACGTNFHLSCIQRWGTSTNYRGGRKDETTCPNCRQPWVGSGTPKSTPTKEEGYTNLGQLQGQSSERDTSTYHSSPYAHWNKRSRFY